MNRRQFACGAIVYAACGARAAARSSVRALTGDSFFDGVSEIRLTDVIAPAPLEPYGADASLVLNRLINSGPISVVDVAPPDRWNRRVARVSFGAGSSLQEALADAGSVRVRPQSMDAAFIATLLSAENQARAARRGLWADWRYRKFNSGDAAPAIGAFNLVEGIVIQTVTRSGRAYLNFGEDYRTDFTATAKTRDTKKWAKDGLDLLSLAGAQVRVRGHVAWINGPSVELAHPQQLEVLTPPTEQGAGIAH